MLKPQNVSSDWSTTKLKKIMKFLKGCLISLIIFVGICTIGWLLLQNNVKGNLENLNRNIEQNWRKYTENLKKRNTELTQQSFKNDSLKYYWNKSKSISLSACSEELEFNEYKINQFVMSDSLVSNLDDEINSNLDIYNQAVRSYHEYRGIFPNFLIARKTQFPKYFKYFDYRYGIDNEKAMIRKKKRKDWIKNGGPYPA